MSLPFSNIVMSGEAVAGLVSPSCSLCFTVVATLFAVRAGAGQDSAQLTEGAVSSALDHAHSIATDGTAANVGAVAAAAMVTGIATGAAVAT